MYVLGVFRKLRKVAINFVMSVCSTACMEQLSSHWIDFHEIWYLRTVQKSVGKSQVPLKSDKNTGYFTWRPHWILRMRNVSNKSCTENKNIHFTFNNFLSQKFCCLWDLDRRRYTYEINDILWKLKHRWDSMSSKCSIISLLHKYIK
jgi:hypothetical protein